MGFLKTKSRIEHLPPKDACVFVSPKDGKMPKYGHIHNILRFLTFDSATQEQIGRNFASKTLNSVRQRDFVVEKNGRFYITSEGRTELSKLKLQFKSNGV